MSAPAITVFGLSGKAGAGKDYLYARYFRPLGFRRIALADAFKITAVGRGVATYEEVFHTKPPHVRDALQKMGTEEGRDKYGEDVWTNTAGAWMEHFARTWGETRFCVTDIRFPNEVAFVERLGGVVLRVQAPQRVAQNGMPDALRAHPSETALDQWRFKEIVLNDPDHAFYLPSFFEKFFERHGITRRQEIAA